MSLRTVILTCVLLPLLVSCAGGPPTVRETQLPEEAVAAQALYTAGDYAGAAQAWLGLAGRQPEPRATEYRLEAANALIAAGQLEQAAQVLGRTRTKDQPPLVRARVDLLDARLALARQQAYQALPLLDRDYGVALPPELIRERQELLAEAYAQSGNYIEAVRARIALEPWLQQPQEIQDNRSAVWTLLSRLDATVLEQLPRAATEPLFGWMELAILAQRHANDPKLLAQALDQWQVRHPAHPAAERIVPDLLEASRFAITQPRHLALLLPVDGPFRKAAAAVRDGFLAAWYAAQEQDPAVEEVPDVALYAVTPTTLWSVYQQAVDGGADFIVGPLDKASVTQLALAESLLVPTLALNHADDPVAEREQAPGEDPVIGPAQGLYQFALSPESEARRVAEHTWMAGHHQGLLLVPESAWGTRVRDAFQEAWRTLGGEISGQRAYRGTGQEMSQAVAGLLNVDRSEQRGRALGRYLGVELEFEPRRRQDVDFVFMAAFPEQARQLRPQLKFHHASVLPVFATSHAYAGNPDPQEDRDLNGVTFGDMPWVLTPQTADPGLQQMIRQNWPGMADRYTRLFALGVDAYRVIPYLGRLRAQPFASFEGVTGRLRLDPSGRIERDLLWAQFVQGVPRLLEQGAGVANP